MAHLIEQFTDGTAAFASARKDAWHRLGTVTKGAMTAEEAMSTAYLAGWNVRKLPLTATVIDDKGLPRSSSPTSSPPRATTRRPAAWNTSAWSAPATRRCRTKNTATC
jgi:hypothetical protein